MKKQIIFSLAIIAGMCIIQSCAIRPCTDISANLAGVHSRFTGDGDSWSGAWGFQAGAEALVPFNCDFPLQAWGGLNISMQGAGWESLLNLGNSVLQDRILFGTDTEPDAEAYRIYYRFLETDDEYIDPAGGHHLQGRWMIYGLYLPDEVLEKIYYKNALRILEMIKRPSS